MDMVSLALFFFVFACIQLPNVEASPLFDRQQAANDSSSSSSDATYLRRAPFANETLRQWYKLKRDAKPRIQPVKSKSIKVDDKKVSLEDADLESVDRDLFAPNARFVMNGRVQTQLPQPAVYRSRADGSVTITKDHEGNVLWVTKRAADNSGKTTDLFYVDSDTLVTITSDEIDQVALNQKFQYAHVEVPPEHSSRRLWDTHASNQTTTTTALAGNNYQHQHRSLAACGSFDVIQVAIAFESTFCAAFDNKKERAQNAVLTTVYEANKLYQVPGLCKRLVISRLEGYCDYKGDPYQSMITRAQNVCGDGTELNLLARFRKFWDRNRSFVKRDTAHLFHGKAFSTSIIGCAYRGTLCETDYAYGVNFVTFTPYTSYWPILFGHEVGHIAGANHDCDDCTFVMRPRICLECTTWSKRSMQEINRFVSQSKCVNTVNRNNGACLQDLNCNDQDACTRDTCNTATGTCIFARNINIQSCSQDREQTCTNPQQCGNDNRCCPGFQCRRSQGRGEQCQQRRQRKS